MLYDFLTLTFSNFLYNVLPTLVYFSKIYLIVITKGGYSLIKDDEKQNYRYGILGLIKTALKCFLK